MSVCTLYSVHMYDQCAKVYICVHISTDTSKEYTGTCGNKDHFKWGTCSKTRYWTPKERPWPKITFFKIIYRKLSRAHYTKTMRTNQRAFTSRGQRQRTSNCSICLLDSFSKYFVTMATKRKAYSVLEKLEIV